MENNEPIPEELAEQKAAEYRELLAKCAEDRRQAKDRMLERLAKEAESGS